MVETISLLIRVRGDVAVDGVEALLREIREAHQADREDLPALLSDLVAFPGWTFWAIEAELGIPAKSAWELVHGYAPAGQPSTPWKRWLA